MSFEAEAQVIEARFSTEWGSTTDIKWDNVDYVPTAGTSYATIEIHNSNANVAGFGGTDMMYRMRGLISINIYVALNSGTRAARVLTDAAAEIFRGVEFSGIVCSAPTIARVGQVEDWFVYNVTVPFYRNEIL
jgi:hypothetical protein